MVGRGVSSARYFFKSNPAGGRDTHAHTRQARVYSVCPSRARTRVLADTSRSPARPPLPSPALPSHPPPLPPIPRLSRPRRAFAGVDPDRSAGVSSPSRVSGLRSAFIVAAATASAPAAAEVAAARVTSARSFSIIVLVCGRDRAGWEWAGGPRRATRAGYTAQRARADARPHGSEACRATRAFARRGGACAAVGGAAASSAHGGWYTHATGCAPGASRARARRGEARARGGRVELASIWLELTREI